MSKVGERLICLNEVMARLRVECPRGKEQTHFPLLTHLIEETCEAVDTVEDDTNDNLREEPGNLLFQMYFHVRIAENEGRFVVDDVTRGIAGKLTRRHPHVLGDGEVPEGLCGVWERRERREKGRILSLDGTTRSMNSLARAQKVIAHTRSHEVPVRSPSEPAAAKDVRERVQALVARVQASRVDADAAVRGALRSLEERIRRAEGPTGTA